MDKNIRSMFQFKRYVVDNIEFHINPHYRHEKPVEIDFNLLVSIEIDNECKRSIVTLFITIFDNAYEKQFPFTLKISISGYFETEDEISREELLKFAEINGTAILYPYLRSIVSDITRTSNISPLILPVINVYTYLQSRNGLDSQQEGN